MTIFHSYIRSFWNTFSDQPGRDDDGNDDDDDDDDDDEYYILYIYIFFKKTWSDQPMMQKLAPLSPSKLLDYSYILTIK